MSKEVDGPDQCELKMSKEIHGPDQCELKMSKEIHGPDQCELKMFKEIHGPNQCELETSNKPNGLSQIEERRTKQALEIKKAQSRLKTGPFCFAGWTGLEPAASGVTVPQRVRFRPHRTDAIQGQRRKPEKPGMQRPAQTDPKGRQRVTKK